MSTPLVMQYPTWLVALSDDQTAAPSSWIQLARIGQFVSNRYGKFSITKDDLSQMLSNFRNVTPIAPTELSVDYDHLSMDPKKPMDGKAAGWFKDLELRDDGETLWGKVDWTPDAAKAIRDKEYQFVSPSFVKDYVSKQGKKIGTTLLAAAITNHPFLEGMQAVTINCGVGEFAALVPGGEMVVYSLADVGQRVTIKAMPNSPTYEVAQVMGTGDSQFVQLKGPDGAAMPGWYLVTDLAPAPATNTEDPSAAAKPGATAAPAAPAAPGGAPAAPAAPGTPGAAAQAAAAAPGVPGAMAPAAPHHEIHIHAPSAAPAPAAPAAPGAAPAAAPAAHQVHVHLSEAAFTFEQRRLLVQAALQADDELAEEADETGDDDDADDDDDIFVRDLTSTEAVYGMGSRTYSRPYSIDADGAVKFSGPAVEGVMGFVPMAKVVSKGVNMSATFKLTDTSGKEFEVSRETLTAMAKDLVPAGSVIIAASDVAELQTRAKTQDEQVKHLSDQVELLATTLANSEKQSREMQLDTALTALSKAGRITKPMRDWAFKQFSQGTDLSAFEEWQATVPAQPIVKLEMETGSGGGAGAEDVTAELMAKATQLSADRKISFRDAVIEASRQDGVSSERYQESFRPQ